MSRACPAFVGFAANAPSHCAVSPLRYRVAFANAIASARPPCTPACLIDAGASLSQSQPFDFCNEFSMYDTRARILRALSSPAAGVGPAVVATHDALLTLPDSSSFGCKEGSSSMRRSELRVFIPRHSPSRGKPQKPESLCPHERHCSSGPAGHGIRAGRKNRVKGERGVILRSRPTRHGLRRVVLPRPLSSTFCHQRCVRDGMEARSRACTRPHRRPRHSFRLPPREGQRLSEHLGCFSPLEPNGGRDRSLDLLGLATRQDLLVTQP